MPCLQKTVNTPPVLLLPSRNPCRHSDPSLSVTLSIAHGCRSRTLTTPLQMPTSTKVPWQVACTFGFGCKRGPPSKPPEHNVDKRHNSSHIAIQRGKVKECKPRAWKMCHIPNVTGEAWRKAASLGHESFPRSGEIMSTALKGKKEDTGLLEAIDLQNSEMHLFSDALRGTPWALGSTERVACISMCWLAVAMPRRGAPDGVTLGRRQTSQIIWTMPTKGPGTQERSAGTSSSSMGPAVECEELVACPFTRKDKATRSFLACDVVFAVSH